MGTKQVSSKLLCRKTNNQSKSNVFSPMERGKIKNQNKSIAFCTLRGTAKIEKQNKNKVFSGMERRKTKQITINTRSFPHMEGGKKS